MMTNIKEIFSSLLPADFFAIVIFLFWFLAASIQKEFMNSAYLLERFQDIFLPVVQPALGFLMIGSIASGLASGDEKKREMNAL